MTITQRYKLNQAVLHNEHIFKKHFKNIGELAYLSNARIAEKEAKQLEKNNVIFE